MEQLPALAALRTTPHLFEQVAVDPGGYGVSWNDDVDLDCEDLWAIGQPITTPFSGLLSFADATALWGLSESTLRKAVAYRKLRPGQDVMKFGKQWVVCHNAMTREYGPQP